MDVALCNLFDIEPLSMSSITIITYLQTINHLHTVASVRVQQCASFNSPSSISASVSPPKLLQIGFFRVCTASTLCDIEFHKFACLSPFANTGGEGHFRDGYTLKNLMNFRKISEGGVWGVIFDRNIFSENKGELRSYLISASRILV